MSTVTLGPGYIITLDKPSVSLCISPLLVILAHMLIVLPFVVRSVLPAPPWRVRRKMHLPTVARMELVRAVFAFTVSMGRLRATSLVVRPERPTMPVAIYRFLARLGAANQG